MLMYSPAAEPGFEPKGKSAAPASYPTRVMWDGERTLLSSSVPLGSVAVVVRPTWTWQP